MTEKARYQEAVAAFLQKQKSASHSLQTCKNYEKAIGYFSDFMQEDNQWQKPITYEEVVSFRDHKLKCGKKLSTVAQYLRCLHAFFEFASDECLGGKWYTINPIGKSVQISAKAEKRPYEQILTDEQVKLLWVNRNTTGCKNWSWARNYAVIVLILSSELRNSEILNLTLEDLDFENEEIIVQHGKGDKYRAVDFPKIAQSAILLYLESGVRPDDCRDDEPLFGTTAEQGTLGCRPTGGEWHKGSSQWLSELVRRHVLAITGVDNVRTHDLRHVGARLDLNNGMEPVELQAKLGHESFTTTQIYSGRLLSRKRRKNASEVFVERDRVAEQNFCMLQMMQNG